jgi:hypothetical protein
MKRIASLVLYLTLAACSTVDQREPTPTSNFNAAHPGAGDAIASTTADTPDRIELTGDLIPAGTALKFVVIDAVSSATAQVGDTFHLQTRTSVLLNGAEILPSGASAQGEVIHADRRGMLGKPGELLLKLRTMQWQGRPIKLRNSSAGLAKDKTNTAMTVSVLFGIAGFFVAGDNVEIPAGTIILGDLAESISVVTSTQNSESSIQTTTR